jgi:hypothetical protein
MRIKPLFSIPDGEKVTEKALRRVLVSSVCGMLLCMSCLVSTTWAWFAVSVENPGNEIAVAKVTHEVTVSAAGVPVASSDGSYALSKGEYSVEAQIHNDATDTDAFGHRSAPVYLVMTVVGKGEPESYYIEIKSGSGTITQEISIADAPVRISFSVSWVQPAQADPVGDGVLTIGEMQTGSSTETTTGSAESETE